ncbi:MAG: ethanolamine ammonia-lyase subunit EutB [Nannocystis sp.]|nr:ethanolamine ammonia-lyase subunit EutB [Nannocystis sp.]
MLKTSPRPLPPRSCDPRALALATLPSGASRLRRRAFISALIAGGVALAGASCKPDEEPPLKGVTIPEIREGEDIFAYITRVRGGFDQTFYKAIIGAANEYKEGDEALGIHALDQKTRDNARVLLGNTKIADLRARPIYEDAVFDLIEGVLDDAVTKTLEPWTMAELRDFLLAEDEPAIQAIIPGLPSDIIGMVVKLMTNDQLIAVGQKVFTALPGSKIGAKGYMGARIQPNSPTDNVDDIAWQVFSGWSYAVGDVVLGTNPVSSEVDSVAAVESTLKDIIDAFGLAETIPHCVLSHIDVQADVEVKYPGSTALWFQSLGSTVDANATFDVTVEGMLAHAAARAGKYGLYFETGQGADATNGHGAGFDMVVHESRKYGFARALQREVAKAQAAAGNPVAPWVHLNDVAGFIGPEVFRTREQLVRCCLEDTVMGKLHGLPIGLDICSTLHMEVNLDDLDWCIDQVMPANPAYLMALPTKNDPMLSYLTTAFQDHVRVRERFGYKVDDAMWSFFQLLGVIDPSGQPTEHFGDPLWVYLKYLRAKGDMRAEAEIFAEGEAKIAECDARGVFIARGHGAEIWQLDPVLDQRVRALYEDAKLSIFSTLPDDFAKGLPAAVSVVTQSESREDYILHPPTGEELSEQSARAITELAAAQAGAYDVQLILSDGLAANALTDPGHLQPYLDAVRPALDAAGYKVAPEHIVVTTGRVRAGYQIGELLYGGLKDGAERAILHIIGERPGSGHRAYSVYITAPKADVWGAPGKVDHDITKVIAGVADSSLDPALAATQTVDLLLQLAPR